MKTGDQVVYRDAAGDAYNAVVVGVGGSGPSNGKLLDLDVPELGHALLDVSHVADAEAGCGYWYLGESVPEPTEITPAVIDALANDLDLPSAEWVDQSDE